MIKRATDLHDTQDLTSPDKPILFIISFVLSWDHFATAPWTHWFHSHAAARVANARAPRREKLSHLLDVLTSCAAPSARPGASTATSIRKFWRNIAASRHFDPRPTLHTQSPPGVSSYWRVQVA